MLTYLDRLAREYVDLTLTKQQCCDTWDVYWLADTPFWKRTDPMVSRETPVYPYKPSPKMPEMTLFEILRSVQMLYEKLQALEGTLEGNDAIRLRFLTEHTRSLLVRTKLLYGDRPSYNSYTADMFGLTAPEWNEEDYRLAKAELTAVLPGEGDFMQRIRAYREALRIPTEKLPTAMNAAARFFHDAGVKYMGIKDSNMPRLRYRKIPGDRLFITVLYGYDYDEITLEQNFNINSPYYLDNLREIAAHELEPGHFTFMSLRTKGMVDTSYPELGLNSHGPSGAFIEGGARIAMELTLDTPEKERAFDEEMFDLCGADKALIDGLAAWRRFEHVCDYAKLEIERKLWDGIWTKEQAAEFARAQCILTDDEPNEALERFFHDEGHYTSHSYCTDVVRNYYNKKFSSVEERWAAYTRLCQYPFVMAEIEAGTFDPFEFVI